MGARANGRGRGWHAGAVALAAAVVFVAANVTVGNLVKTARLDLTQERLYTLDDATREVLAGIDEPITLSFFKSAIVDELGGAFATHARRTDEMLTEFRRHAGDGMLMIERYDPVAYSPAEDRALAAGLQGIPISADGQQIFFGIGGINSTDDREAIGYLAPDRAPFLEYDLARLVYDLANPEKPQVVMIGDLPVMGDAMSRYQPWVVTEVIRQFFDFRQLGGTVERIDDAIEILILAQPSALDAPTLYAIDQFVMRGGRVLAFLDPAPEAMLAASQPGQPPPGFADLEPLLDRWGVDVPADRVVGDPNTAVMVEAGLGGRSRILQYLPWLDLDRRYMDADSVVLAELERVTLSSPGHVVAREGAETVIEPLLVSSADAGLFETLMVTMMPDPAGLLAAHTPEGAALTLAARVTGPVASAFPDGPPDGVTEEGAADRHLGEAEAPLNLVIVADGDMLADGAWVQRQALLGQSYALPFANNGDFVVNVLDTLSGNPGLMGLRGRGTIDRPFTLLGEMRRAAERAFQDRERELLARIEEAEQQIRALQEREAEAGILLTAEQQSTIEAFRADVLDLRAELREVRHNLRQDVEAVERTVKAVNIWAVPAAAALIAMVLALVRRRRRRRSTALRAEATREAPYSLEPLS